MNSHDLYSFLLLLLPIGIALNNPITEMENDEIQRQIELEKTQLKYFLITAERLRLPNEEKEKQVNFYLEKIADLLKQIR